MQTSGGLEAALHHAIVELDQIKLGLSRANPETHVPLTINKRIDKKTSRSW